MLFVLTNFLKYIVNWPKQMLKTYMSFVALEWSSVAVDYSLLSHLTMGCEIETLTSNFNQKLKTQFH